MPFYIFAWIASIVYGVETILIKALNKHLVKNPYLVNYLWAFSSVIFLIPLAIMKKAPLPVQWDIVIITAFVNSIFALLFVLALSKIDVSVFSPLFSFKTVFSVVLGWIFLKEILTPLQILFIGIIFLAGFFVSMDEKFSYKSFFNKAVVILLFSAFFYAVFSVLINKTIAVNGYWSSNLWVAVVNLFFLSFTFPLFRKDILTIKPVHFFPVFIVALAEIAGNLTSIKAYSENVGISSAIISLPLSMVMTIGLSFIYPKLLEKHKFKVYVMRIFSAVIMVYSALQLSR